MICIEVCVCVCVCEDILLNNSSKLKYPPEDFSGLINVEWKLSNDSISLDLSEFNIKRIQAVLASIAFYLFYSISCCIYFIGFNLEANFVETLSMLDAMY
jgi:hypothetical protein